MAKRGEVPGLLLWLWALRNRAVDGAWTARWLHRGVLEGGPTPFEITQIL